MSLNWSEHIEHVGEVAAVVVPFFLWLLRWTRRIDTTVRLTDQVTTVHLPHVYRRQFEHDIALNIVPVEHPNIGLTNGSAAQRR